MLLLILVICTITGGVHLTCFKNASENVSWSWSPAIGSVHQNINNKKDCLEKCINSYECVAMSYKVKERECYLYNFMVEENICQNGCESMMMDLPVPVQCNQIKNIVNPYHERKLHETCLPVLQLCKENIKLKDKLIEIEKAVTKGFKEQKQKNDVLQEKITLNEKIIQFGMAGVDFQYIKQLLGRPECMNYNILDEADRAQTVIDRKKNFCDRMNGDTYYPKNCDKSRKWVGRSWYRFKPPAGTKMAEKPPARYSCGTHGPGWLSDPHPKNVGETKDVKFCINWNSKCLYHARGKVTNCGNFFVYYLPEAPYCVQRWCAA